MGKRSGVRAVSKTSIEIDFYYKGVRCRERKALKPTPANLKWAQNLKGAIENEIEKGTFDYSEHFPDSPRLAFFAKQVGDTMTVKTALLSFIEKAESEVAKSTYQDWYRSIHNILIPEFGHLKLSEIRQAHVKDWIGTHDLSQKRICNILTPLRRVISEAREDEIIERDSLADFKVKARQVDKLRKFKKDDIDPFDNDEIEGILRHLHPQAANYVIFAVWTGLRVEEMLEVKWTDIDEKKGVIRIRRARTRGAVKEPKTPTSEREVKLLEPARKALAAQKEFTLLQKAHIFHDPRTGETYSTDKQFREWQWRRALRKAKLRYRPPKQLRHTYATWMIGAGEPIKWVSTQMGHKSTKMTLDIYARWLPKTDTEVGSRAERMWSSSHSTAHKA